MKKTAKLILDAIKDSGMEYKILNTLNDCPQHIRIDKFCDVYPSTGTWQDAKLKWHRNDVSGFIRYMINSESKPKAKSLESRVADLEDYTSYLEIIIKKLRTDAGL